MKQTVITIEGRRDAYAPEQIITSCWDSTMTVRELIEELEAYDEDALVMLDNDNGYTFGTITYSSFNEIKVDTDEVDED